MGQRRTDAGARHDGLSTLRQRALAVLGTADQPWLTNVAEVLATCPVLDATEAFSYLWHVPEEKNFRFGDIPVGGVPEPFRGGASSPPAVLVEADPAASANWAMLVDERGRAGGVPVRDVVAAAAAGGVETAKHVGEPGAVSVGPGLVRRVGALVYWEEVRFDEEIVDYYERLLGPRVAGEVRHTVQMVSFAELDDGSEGVFLQLPQLIWYLPLGGDGRIKTAGADEEAVTMVVPPGHGLTTPGGASADAVARGHRPLKLAVLFSLACANAALSGRDGSPTLERAGADAFGTVWRLGTRSFERLLDERGGARTLGLSHALAVCRDEFAPADRAEDLPPSDEG